MRRVVGRGSGLRRVRHRVVKLLAGVAARGMRFIPDGGRLSRFLVRRTWSLGSSEMLDAYLVSGYQNPRLNVQSVLLRHALVRRLFGSEFDQLMDEELRFVITLNEALRLRARELGVRMGSYLDPERYADVQRVEEAISPMQGEFESRWRTALAGRDVAPLTVLELACGSANDYRAFDAYGLAPYLDYLGVDLTAKNIANARRRFPGVRFEVADILDLPHPDASFDLVIASDIFEHLSPDGLERALDEVARLSRTAAVLNFFNMGEQPEHDVERRRAYYWSCLSRPLIAARLGRSFGALNVVPIATWLRDQFGYAHTYNANAFTIQADRREGPPD